MSLFSRFRMNKENNSNDKFSNKSLTIGGILNKLTKKLGSKEKASTYLAKNMYKYYVSSDKFSKGTQIKNLLRKIDIDIPDDGFIFFLDEFKNLSVDGKIIDAFTIDYSKVINNSLYDFNNIYLNYNEGYFVSEDGFGFKSSENDDYDGDENNHDFIKNQQELLDGIELLVYRIIKELRKSNHQNKAKYIRFFESMIDENATHFEEGLQRILFYNQLLWQTGHKFNGLGRLDRILEDLYFNDLNNGYITEYEGFVLIKEFLKTLNSYSWYKNDDYGISGQTIVLGGKYVDDFGKYYFYNDLTFMFLKAVRELKMDNPQIILRINEDTPDDLLDEALKTSVSGVSNLLFSNDDVVIDKIISSNVRDNFISGKMVSSDVGDNFISGKMVSSDVGDNFILYSKVDAYNYVVSKYAGVSILSNGFEQEGLISLLKPLNLLFDKENESDLKKLDFDSLLDLYKTYLKVETDNVIMYLDNIWWNKDPLLSLFEDNCNLNKLDISNGGAKYNDYIVNIVALENTVNSLYNIKKLVFDSSRYELIELNKMRKNGFKRDKYQDTFNLLSNMGVSFGKFDKEIIELTDNLIKYVESLFEEYTNQFGGKIVLGLSVLSCDDILSNKKYINGNSSSFDGRKSNDDVSNVISLNLDEGSLNFIKFVAMVDAGVRGNGTVIQLNIPSKTLQYDSFDLTNFLNLAIKQGFYQMQINVVN